MKRILADVNVVLDAVLKRPPHDAAAARLWRAGEKGEVEMVLAAHGVTTVFYLLARTRGAAAARNLIGSVVATFGVAAVDVAVIQRALALGWTDFEDAVTAAAAEAARCDAVVTRDPKGFAGSTLPVMSAETAVALLAGDLPEGVGERPTTRHRRPRARH